MTDHLDPVTAAEFQRVAERESGAEPRPPVEFPRGLERTGLVWRSGGRLYEVTTPAGHFPWQKQWAAPNTRASQGKSTAHRADPVRS